MKKLFAIWFLLGAAMVHAQDTKPFEIFGMYGTQQGWVMTNLSAGVGYRVSSKPFDEITFRYGYTVNGYDQFRLGTKKRVLTFTHLGIEWTTDYGFSILCDTGAVKFATSTGVFIVVPISVTSFSAGVVLEKTLSIDPFPEFRMGFSYSLGKSR